MTMIHDPGHDPPARQEPHVTAETRAPSGPHHRFRVAANSRAHRLLLGLGLAGSVIFNATFLIDGAARPGYGALRQPMSALSLGPGGWVQITNFIAFGVLSCCSALGWRATLAPGTGATWYPRLKVLAGLSLIGAGLFSQDPALGFPPGSAALASPTLHAQIHNAASVISLTATVTGFLVLGRRFAREPSWRGWATYARVTSVLMVFFLVTFVVVTGRGGPGGMFEKLASITALIFTTAVIGRLLRRGPHLPSTASS